jgi:hypothetical protein
MAVGVISTVSVDPELILHAPATVVPKLSEDAAVASGKKSRKYEWLLPRKYKKSLCTYYRYRELMVNILEDIHHNMIHN